MKTLQHGLIREAVETEMAQYFIDLDEEEKPNQVWRMVLKEMEESLMDVVLKHANENSTKAAAMLGLSRNTLRKKLIRMGRLAG